MKILITGASGLLGSALVSVLATNYPLVIISRNIAKTKEKIKQKVDFYQWDNYELPKNALKGVTGVINLAGENIANKRWTQKQKQKIYESRIKTTKNLVQSCNLLPTILDFFISASAIGYYPAISKQNLDENSLKGEGFLANLCQDWEQEARGIKAKRLVIFRLGLILSEQGGALAKLLSIFKLGLGGTIGMGKRSFSWIHLEDVVCFIKQAISQSKYQGIFNLTSLQPATNLELTKILAQSLNKKAIFPVAPLFLKVVFGEMSQLLLTDQKVIPQKLLQLNHQFLYPDLKSAILKSLLIEK